MRGDRIVCADSYFASKKTAEAFEKVGMGFLGVVKTATKEFPMAYLSGLELQNRGDYKGVHTLDDEGNKKLGAFVWMDRNRRYFIMSRSSLEPGRDFQQIRMRQVDQEPDAEPERAELSIPQPKAAEIYYSVCGKIDQSNRTRQDDFKLERKLQTKSWHIRVNQTVLGFNDVDTYRVGKLCDLWDGENPNEFYYGLAEEMIDNTYDAIVGNRRQQASQQSVNNSPAAHCTPTRRKRKRKSDQTLTNYSLQGNCPVCKTYKTTMVCTLCH